MARGHGSCWFKTYSDCLATKLKAGNYHTNHLDCECPPHSDFNGAFKKFSSFIMWLNFISNPTLSQKPEKKNVFYSSGYNPFLTFVRSEFGLETLNYFIILKLFSNDHMIVVYCNGCSDRRPDEVIAMNEIGFLVGEHGQFIKRLKFFW